MEPEGNLYAVSKQGPKSKLNPCTKSTLLSQENTTSNLSSMKGVTSSEDKDLYSRLGWYNEGTIKAKKEVNDEYFKIDSEEALIQDMFDVKQDLDIKEELVEPKLELSDTEDTQGEKRRMPKVDGKDVPVCVRSAGVSDRCENIMPPRKKKCSQRKMVQRKPSTTSTSPLEAIVAESSVPERALSPAPSESSVAQSESNMSEAEQSQKGKQRKAKTHINLTPEQEEDMVEWLKAHEILYNKKLRDYKDTKKKAFIWHQQAELIGMTVDDLHTWYTSLRTRFTKLRKKKSGDGATDHSERDQWVCERFSFLAPFTYEVKNRALVSRKSKLVPSATSTPDDNLPLSDQMTSKQSDSLGTTTASTICSTSSTPSSMQSFTSAVSGKIDQFMEMQSRIMQQMVRPNSDRMKEAFIEYIRESVYDIQPSLWEDMHRDIMKTVLMYKDRDSALKRTQRQAFVATPTASAPASTPAETYGSSSGW